MNNYQVRLGQTYYNTSKINLGVNASLKIGNHGDILKIILTDQSEIATSINRTSNKNGAVRLHPDNKWLEFLQNNYDQGNVLIFQIINPNTIKII